MDRLVKRPGLALAIILLLAFGLRLINLGARTLWYDEAFSVLFAEKGWDAMLDGTLTAGEDGAAEEHPLLYYQTLHYWMDVWGQSPGAVRLYSVVLGVATVGVVFLLARDWFSERTALAAALITAVVPFHVQYSQEARMYALLTLALMLATWLYGRAWQRGHWGYWLGFGVLAGISMHVQQLAAFYLLAVGLLPFLVRDRTRIVRTVVAAVLALVIYLPWLVMLPGQLGKLRRYWVQQPTVLHFWLVLRSFTSVNLDFAAGWWVPTFLLAAVLAIFLGYQARRRWQRLDADQRRSVGWALWLAFMPMVFMWGVSIIFEPVFLPRALLPSAVMFYVAMAWLLVDSRLPRAISGVLGVAWTVIIVFGLVTLYTWGTFPNPPFDDAADYLAGRVQDDDPAVIVHGNKITALPMVYYARDLPQRYVRDIPDAGSDTLGRPTQAVLGLVAAENAADAVGDAPRVWYVTFEQLEDELHDLIADDPDYRQYDSLGWLRAHYQRCELARSFNDLDIYLCTERTP